MHDALDSLTVHLIKLHTGPFLDRKTWFVKKTQPEIEDTGRSHIINLFKTVLKKSVNKLLSVLYVFNINNNKEFFKNH